MLRIALSTLPVLFCCFSALGDGAPATPETSTKYLDTVQRACDTILKEGTDRYGKQKTGMILSALKRQSGRPIHDPNLPKPPHGARNSDRTGAGGSNANVQQDLYRVLNHLSRLTGDAKYAAASKKALIDFLVTTQNPDTGLLAWGEHLYWNCLKDKLGDLDPNKTHEPKRKLIFFQELYEAEPERMLKYTRGTWEHQVYDHKTGNFSRHAKYDRHAPRKDSDFEKEAAYFVSDWSQAFEKTQDAYFDNAVRVMASRYLKKLNDRNLVEVDASGLPGRTDKCVPLWMVAMACEAHDATKRMKNPETVKILKELAARHDAGFLALDHEPADPKKGFLFFVHMDTGKPYPDAQKKTDGHSRDWGMGYGVNTTSMFATLCYTRQAQLGEGKQADAYRKLVIQAADLYEKVPPDPKAVDIWAGEYGLAIFTELAAYRLTKERKYLDAAQRIGDAALRDLWDDGAAPLPRTSTKTDYYEVISYPDTTMLALLALHEQLCGLEPQVPISDITR